MSVEIIETGELTVTRNTKTGRVSITIKDGEQSCTLQYTKEAGDRAWAAAQGSIAQQADGKSA